MNTLRTRRERISRRIVGGAVAAIALLSTVSCGSSASEQTPKAPTYPTAAELAKKTGDRVVEYPHGRKGETDYSRYCDQIGATITYVDGNEGVTTCEVGRFSGTMKHEPNDMNPDIAAEAALCDAVGGISVRVAASEENNHAAIPACQIAA